MKKIAFVTGMTGQDGPYLAKHLLENDYKVYGLVKRYSNPNLSNLDYLGIQNDVELITGDITDDANMIHLIKTIRPNEFYNLAAQSFVGSSWEISKMTAEVNAMGVLNILNAIVGHNPITKFYQASTSELYGNANIDGIQNEKTPFRPCSPYGISKLYAYWMTVNFRDSYSLHASNGILFNHESPIRGKEFVTRKVSEGVAKIKLGLAKKLTLGYLDARRDWGFAGDYVEAMYTMVQQKEPGDYVICTGIQHSIRELLIYAFETAGITDWEKYVESAPQFKRPAEVHALHGSYAKAKEVLNWEPKTLFKDMITSMVNEDIKRLSND
ncbi:MAG: GDP-mannose 4,6-dehydratase [Proteobacteria bacterium]|nr:GDP-mannose 4,6-dehydratase [Pseudomonadota bacterium]